MDGLFANIYWECHLKNYPVNTVIKRVCALSVWVIAMTGSLILFDPLSVAAKDVYASHINNIIALKERNREQHAQILLSVARRWHTTHDYLEIHEEGEGAFGVYQNIFWKTQSFSKLVGDQLQILESNTQIHDVNGRLLTKFIKTYDYDKKMVTFQRLNAKEEIEHEEKFSFDGPICDDTNLVHFIRGILAEGHKDTYESFYLLTNEPKLYKVNMDHKGPEILNFPGRNVEANKFQLKADLGPLTEIAAILVSPTYVWYTKDYPYQWVQYQGMQSGRFSEYLITYVTDLFE